MKLLKQDIEKENGNKYTDLYACWTFEGKTYCVRVRPVFGRDNDKLMSVAQAVPKGEAVEKYA